MKKVFALLLALVLMAGLGLAVLVQALPRFLQDSMQLHSAALFAAPVVVDVPQLDRDSRTVRWDSWRIETVDGAMSPLRIATLSLRVPADWRPDWSSSTLLPAVMPLEAVVVDGVELGYDIDREQLALRSEDSPAVSYKALQQAIAAAVKADAASQRFLVQQLAVRNIRVHARSEQSPDSSRAFPVGDMLFTRLGEGGAGITAAAMTETVSRALTAEVQRQALALHVIEVPREEELAPARRHANAEPAQDDAGVGQKEESGAKRAAKSVNQAIDKGWKGIKKIFD